ncbi:Putative mitochondrial ribosomal protein [Gryllus bimaculatus]|nr:Putative mitochondrial ribosomal protein [Gryllus bimaculatus]
MLRKYSSLLSPIFKVKNIVENVHNKRELNLVLRNSEHKLSLCRDVLRTTPSRNFHWSLPRSKREDKREMLASMPVPDEGTEGEKTVDVDSLVQRAGNIYPDKSTFSTLYDGIPFSEIPIFNISVTKNNTVFSVTDAKGVVKLFRTCGLEGFKNARKGTNVAAQATAIALGSKAYERGFKTVRVRVRGLGPGRMTGELIQANDFMLTGEGK